MQTDHDEHGQAYRSDTTEPTETKRINWMDLPVELRDMLGQQFETEMRENYDSIKHELQVHFMEQPEIAEMWYDFYEQNFKQEMHSPDTEWHFNEWLRERGVEP